MKIAFKLDNEKKIKSRKSQSKGEEKKRIKKNNNGEKRGKKFKRKKGKKETLIYRCGWIATSKI
jgi:hypothetical protein